MTDSFPDGGKAAVGRAIDAGVEMMVLPAVDRESVKPMIALYQDFPVNTSLAMGLHPTEVETSWREELKEIVESVDSEDIAAIGETGIDLYWDKSNLHRQMDAFGEQIQMAIERNLPVIVHSRDALKETIEVISGFSSRRPVFVFHSFTAGREEAEKLLEAAPEAFFGINGVVTFKNAEPLREAVKHLDESRIVTETDAPFLAPVPFRGKTNESSYIPYIVKAIADAKGVTEDYVARLTHENALRLFPKLRIQPNLT